MSHQPQQTESDAIDRLVAEHLDRVSQQIDASGLIDRLCGLTSQRITDVSQPTVTARPVMAGEPRRWRGTLAWLLGSALVVAVAFVSGRWITPSVADAATMLQEVHAVHLQPVDRCYQVHFSPDPEYWNGSNPLTGPSDTVLWTRGDRFWADATLGKITLVYGRDEQGKLWVSPSRSTGIRLASKDDELPDEIAMYCAINSLTVPTLVENVLADFDLRSERPADRTLPEAHRTGDVADGSVIWATIKPGHTHPLIASALLEINRSDTLVKLILWTVADGRPRGTVTFTLVETARVGDEQYRLQSHLDADAKVRVHQLESDAQHTEELDR